MAPKKKMTPSQRKRVFDSLFKTNAMTVMEIVEKTELPTQQVRTKNLRFYALALLGGSRPHSPN